MQNAQDLKTFLDVYPNVKSCSLQIFMDDKTKEWIPQILPLGKMDRSKRQNICRLNDNSYWIFFSVNSMIEWKRNKESVVWVNAWVCEVDWLSKEDQLRNIDNAPIKPSMIIESKKSFHMYWFAKDWTKENRSKICWWLKNYFYWDPAIANDISRVLRLPWFYHCKDSNDKFLCSIREVNWEYYTEQQMLDAFKNTETDSEREEKVRRLEQSMRVSYSVTNDNDWFWRKANELDTQMMLERLSWTKYLCWDTITFKHNSNGTQQIVVNWKTTWSWIDRNGKIGSTSKGWPNRTDWVKWYWWSSTDWCDLYKVLVNDFPEMKQNNQIEQTTKTKVEQDNNIVVETDKYEKVNIDFKKTPYTRWDKWIDEELGRIWDWWFVIIVWAAWNWKTEFCMFNAMRNADEWTKVDFITLEMSKDSVIKRTAIKRAGITKWERDTQAMSDRQREIMDKEAKRLEEYQNLFIFTIKNDRSLESLVQVIKNEYKEWVKYFIIDNLWLLSSNGKENEFELQTRASRILKWLTNDLWITIVMVHHTRKLNWLSTSVQNEIRWSQKISDYADFIVKIERDEFENILTIGKDRMWWDSKSIRLTFDKGNFKLKEKRHSIDNPL